MTEHHAGALERYLAFLAEADQLAHAEQVREPAPHATRLPQRTVGDVMTTKVISVSTDATFKQVARLLHDHRIASVPVVDDDGRPLGVVSTSDLLLHVTKHAWMPPRGHRLGAPLEANRKHDALAAGSLMTAPAITTTPTTTIGEAARTAAHARVRMLPVVNAQGVLCGVVSRSDFIRLFLRTDEDIDREVRRRLANTPSVDIAVEHGIVTLTGSVASAPEAGHLAHEAGAVAGVIGIRNHLDFPADVAAAAR